MKLKQAQTGFTLIELVMVIVILGVLSAVALPRFVDLRADANNAAADGVAGALASASSINFAGCSARNNAIVANVCAPVGTTCAGYAALLQAAPAGVVYGGAAPGVVNGTTSVCTATLNGVARNFTAIAAGNP